MPLSRGNLGKGDYKEVLADAPAAKTAVAALKKGADAKQAAADAALAQTKQQWHSLSAEGPKLIAGIHSQVNTLSKMRKLPKGVTKPSFESAKAGAAALDSMWAEATNAVANEDNYAGAVAKRQAVRNKARAYAGTRDDRADRRQAGILVGTLRARKERSDWLDFGPRIEIFAKENLVGCTLGNAQIRI